MARFQEFYRETVVPKLIEQFGYKSVMEVPRIQKITLNMGVGEAVADKKVMDHAVSDMQKIAGQKPVVTKMNITITTTAKTDDEARALLAAFSFPFKN